MGIFPDGNRRWARQRALVPWKGHGEAVKTCRELISWCRDDARVGFLTLWGFSTENWNRGEREVAELMRIYEDFLRGEREQFLKQGTRFVHSGRLDRVPVQLAKIIKELVTETLGQTQFVLNFALDYGGRDEVVRAVQKLGDPASVTEESFRQHLDHPELPDFDLIIRTSGEQRTSGFFVWQAAYAEWFFEDKFFPDLRPADVARIVNGYSRRQRRFGS